MLSQKKKKKDYKFSEYLGFILPSLLGAILLMMPFKYQGDTTIVIALLSDMLTESISGILSIIIMAIICFTGIITFLYKFTGADFIERNSFLKELADVSITWVITRFLAVILVFLVYFELGPEWIWSDATGGLIFYDLILGLFSIFLFASIFLPLLTDYGLLEFVGVLLTPVMRPLFKLPGRSSIDSLVSWIGDGTMGVTLTNNQYEEGHYTEKEAAIIATTFSAVSITFSLIVLDKVGLTNLFGPYYLTIMITGVIAAIIMPRIPPLSRKRDVYAKEIEDKVEFIPEGYSGFEWGLELAIEKSDQKLGPIEFLKMGLKRAVNMWLDVLPVIMSFGTIALIIAEYTPFFQWLGLPFIPIFKLFNVPYAVEASQTVMVGFADMFLPSIIGASIPSEMTRFIVATLSVTQLVYLSEAGAVILGTKIPVSLKDLFIIFIQRTLISLPIIILAAKLIF